MKKTVITLAALAMASVASGATVLTLDSAALKKLSGTYTDTENKIATSGYGNYSITLALDAQKFLSAVTADPFSVVDIITADASNDVTLAIKSDSRYGTGLYGVWNSDTTPYGFWTSTATDNAVTGITALTDYLNNSGATYTGVGLTFEITGTQTSGGAIVYLTLVDSEGTATTLYGINGTLKGSSVGDVTALTYNADMVKYLSVDSTALDATAAAAANVAAIQAAAVPEPATATLSLLALAGLAARRRRK